MWLRAGPIWSAPPSSSRPNRWAPTVAPGWPAPPPQDKVIPKLDFVQGCAAVYAASIGANSIKRLMAMGVQPIIVDAGHDILDLLNEVSLALVYGGLPWVDRANAVAAKTDAAARIDDDSGRLVASVDELA